MEQESNITIYRGWLEKGKHVWSPFVIKVESRLRFAHVGYATEPGSTRSAPKGKIPYVECRDLASGEPAVTLGDSSLIIRALCERGALPHLNARLSPEDKALDLSVRALLE